MGGSENSCAKTEIAPGKNKPAENMQLRLILVFMQQSSKWQEKEENKEKKGEEQIIVDSDMWIMAQKTRKGKRKA